MHREKGGKRQWSTTGCVLLLNSAQARVCIIPACRSAGGCRFRQQGSLCTDHHFVFKGGKQPAPVRLRYACAQGGWPLCWTGWRLLGWSNLSRSTCGAVAGEHPWKVLAAGVTAGHSRNARGGGPADGYPKGAPPVADAGTSQLVSHPARPSTSDCSWC